MRNTSAFDAGSLSAEVLMLADDPEFDALLARDDHLDPRLVFAFARHQPLSDDDFRQVEDYLMRNPDAWATVDALRELDEGNDDFTEPSLIRRLCNVFSVPPAQLTPVLAHASEGRNPEGWRQIAFDANVNAAGLIRFDEGEPIVTIQSSGWVPGSLIVLSVTAAEECSLAGEAVLPVQEDAVPFVEMPIALSQPQAVAVAFREMGIGDFDENLGDAIRESFEIEALRPAWKTWANSNLESSDTKIREIAAWIVNVAASLDFDSAEAIGSD